MFVPAPEEDKGGRIQMNEQEFQLQVREALEPHSAELTAVLRQLVAHTYPPEVASIDFEVFPDEFTSCFPVRAFFLDSAYTEVFLYEAGKAKYPSPVDPGLLSLEQVYSPALEESMAAACPGIDYLTLAGLTLISWFGERWKEAGGLQFSRQARIALHDDRESYDLVRQSWT